MDERELRTMIAEVKRGPHEPPPLRPDHDRARADRARWPPRCWPRPGWPRRRSKLAYKPTKRGGGGALKILWWQGADPAEPALRHRHQGPGRLADLLRAAGVLGPGRQPRRRTWPPRSPPCRTAGSPRTASRSPGSSRRAWPGTTASRSPPTTACSPGSTSPTRPPRRSIIGTYKDIKVEKVDSHTVKIHFTKPTPFWADAFVGVRGMILPKHLFACLQGRQVPRGADQPQAGRHRAVPVRGLQAGRHRPRRAESRLPHAQPPLLRHHRDEGRRRRRLGRARRHADRRVRLRLEHAGRGRDPQAPGSRAARARSTSWSAATSSTSSATSPIPTRTWTASARASRPRTRS